jgi:hypothetical protein
MLQEKVSNEDRFEPAMKELTEVARNLHQLLRSYGPLWYLSYAQNSAVAA